MNMEASDLPEILTRFDRFPPPLIPPSGLFSFLIALINASMHKCKKNDTALHDAETARAFLCNEKKLIILRNTIPMVGTHNLKCPNANVQSCTIVEPELEHLPDNSPYVHSASINCERLTSGSGNAAYAGYFRFLAQEFMFKEQVTSVFRALANRQDEITSSLLQLGLARCWLESLEDAATACWSMPDASQAPDRFLKQVIWPMQHGNDDFVVVPVMAFGLTRELHQRLNQRRQDEQRPQLISIRVTKVGGTQPINVGPYNAELGGWYQHLYANIPPIPTQKAKEYIRLSKHSKSLFELARRRESLDISTLLHPGVEGMPARIKRQRHANAAAMIIARLMAPVIKLRWQFTGMSDNEKTTLTGHLPDYQQAWLAGTADRQQMELFREAALNLLKTTPFRDGKHDKPLLDNSDNQALTVALTQWLEARL
ncbi:type I-F CRISPR-associated protein Csy1 [Endozoicomonas sp. ONNA2]|uniref:type I-F CRISPR-associated protein Csy1 n=1 Tax=Endozoicomonas sp. ONNA2 TaxID=2828741 RepID=UPI002147793E|nr:type I-F CRISPR-associated protein Csy1 [Endozoicomonas sp. ONNA2]